MRLQLFILLILVAVFTINCGSSHSNAAPTADSNGGSPEVAQTGDGTSSTPTVQVIIDRAPHVKNGSGQRLRLFEKGVLKNTFVISTGRETFDLPPLYNIDPYCSTTPKGHFHPTKLREMYYSNTWATAEIVKDAHGRPVIDPDTLKPQEIIHRAEMPTAVFFTNGVAIHGTEHLKDLGNPASGACVRVEPKEAAVVFNGIAAKKGDDYVKDAPADRSSDPEEWPVRFAVDPKNVVIDVIDSRPQEVQDAIAAQCADDRNWFKEANASCFEEQKNNVANNSTAEQPKPRGFFGQLFSIHLNFNNGFNNPRRQLTDDEVIAVKKFCRAKLRGDLQARRL